MTASHDIGSFYQRYGPSVYRRALQLLGNVHDAEEVTQDVFAGLVEQPSQFEGRSSMMSYLYSVTTHLCWNRLRNSRFRSARLRQTGAAAVDTLEPARAERLAILRQLLARLPEDLIEVFTYYYVDEMSQREIAEVMGCARRTVSDKLQSARALAEQVGQR